MENIKKQHGYLALPRNTILLNHSLGSRLFGLYIALIMDARWYRGDSYFSCVVGSQDEIATRLGITQEKLSRGIHDLISKDKRLIVQHKKFLRLGFFPLFLKDVAEKLYENNYANLNDLYAEMHKVNAEMQENYAKMHKKRGQNTPQRLYNSFKNTLYSSSDTSINIDEIDDEIARLQIETGGCA